MSLEPTLSPKIMKIVSDKFFKESEALTKFSKMIRSRNKKSKPTKPKE